MKLEPLYDRVVVQRQEEDTKNAGGMIVIPDNAKEKPARGRVLAVGKGKPMDDGKLRELAVKIGDIILFGKYSGTEVKFDGKDVVIMSEADILAVVQE